MVLEGKQKKHCSRSTLIMSLQGNGTIPEVNSVHEVICISGISFWRKKTLILQTSFHLALEYLVHISTTVAPFLNFSIVAKDLLLLLTASAMEFHCYFSETPHTQRSAMVSVSILNLDAFLVNIVILRAIYKCLTFWNLCSLQ